MIQTSVVQVLTNTWANVQHTCPSTVCGEFGTYFCPVNKELTTVHLSIPPLSPGTPWGIRGRPMVSINTIHCPSCTSHPSVPKGHYGTSDVPWCPPTQFTVPAVHPIPQSPRGTMGHQGTSHGVHQHNSLSTCVHLNPQSQKGCTECQGTSRLQLEIFMGQEWRRPLIQYFTASCCACYNKCNECNRR